MNKINITKKKIIAWCDFGIKYLIYATIFLTPILFAFFQGNFNTFELNKLVLFRATVSIILVLYLLKVSLVGKFEYNFKKNILLFWLLLLVAYIFGVIFSIHPQWSLFGNYARHQGFLSYFYYLLFFLMLIINLHQLKQIKKIIFIAISSALVVCVYGLVQACGWDPLRWIGPDNRIFSSLGQPNFLGYYLVMVIPISVYYLIFIAKQWGMRLFIGFALAVQLTALVLTYSRGASLGLLAGIVVFIILFLLVNEYKKTLIGLLLLLVISSILIFSNLSTVANFKTGIKYVDRVISSLNFSETSSSSTVRFKYWNASIDEMKERSVWRNTVGCGIDCQESVFVRRYQRDWGLLEQLNAFPDRAHNIILDTLLQFGFVGLVFILLFSGYILVISGRYLKQNIRKKDKKYWLVVSLITIIVIYFTTNLFGFPLTTHYIYLYLYLALLWFIVGKSEEKYYDVSKTSMNFRYLMCFFLFVFLGFVYYSFTINDLIADRYYLQAKRAENRHDCAGMIKNTQEMMFAFPFSNFYKSQFIHFNVNCFDSVTLQSDKMIIIENVLNAIDLLDPKEYEYYSLLNTAHAYSVFGSITGNISYQKAEESYKKLIAISPYITVDYQDYGRMKMWAKDYDKAIEIFKQGIAMAPDLNTPGFVGGHRNRVVSQISYFNELIATCYISKQDYSSAIIYYQKSLELDPKQPRVYKSLADSYYKLGQIDKTIEYNLLGLEQEPKGSEWSFSLALLYREKGDIKKAKEYAFQAIKFDPDNQKIKDLLSNLK